MGHIRHHGMLVTSWEKEMLEEAHLEAVRLGMSVSEIAKSPVNVFYSFAVFPDGSNAWWEGSDQGDDDRAALKKYLRDVCEHRGGAYISWVEVQYGDDDGITKVDDHSDMYEYEES